METYNAVIHRGDPRFCRPITIDGEDVGHLEPSVDHLGMRLPYEAHLTDGSAACFDTLAEARTWVQRHTRTAA
jgi:hypothetical protein